jgi:excisionase family DNA binding protein
MHNDQILTVDEAAELLHATTDTLFQYIRWGELPAARLGKHIVIVYDDLLVFVKTIAARQTARRTAIGTSSDRTVPEQTKATRQSSMPSFVFSPVVRSSSGKRRKRRKMLPQLPADGP